MKLLRPLFSALLFATAAASQTGTEVPALMGLDRIMSGLLQKYEINGAALAVTQNGRLVYARGFGVGDKDLRTPVQPDSLFRVGSISKPLTAVTALRLAQEGRLNLDTPIVTLLGPGVLPQAGIVDSRWTLITVRHLMQHSGGWDADATFDPLLSYTVIEGLGLALPLREPLTRDQVIGFMARQPLQFAPGTKFVYSNFGIMLLGRVIERVAGKPYEQVVRETTLAPLGIQRMALGKALPSQRQLGEVEYYDPQMAPAVYPGIGETVPLSDGGYYFEVIEAAGAWIASPIELLRFVNGVDGRKGPALLNSASLAQMTAKPGYVTGNAGHYGLGWTIEPQVGGGANWSHDGALEGNYALLYRSEAGGVAFALTFNALPKQEAFYEEALAGVGGVLQSVQTWPQGDEFEFYLPASTPRISGVVDSASQQTGVSPGALVTLYGLNLGPETGRGTELDSSGRVTALLAGVQITFDGLPAPLLYVSRNQINAVAPVALMGRSRVTIQISTGGRTASFSAMVNERQPGLFTLSGNGRGLAVALANGLLNSESAPVARGSIATVWASGLGEFSTALRDGEVPRVADPLRQTPRVTIGGQAAEVLYAGTAPGFVGGVVQLNLVIPASALPGRAWVEVASNASRRGRLGVWIWVR